MTLIKICGITTSEAAIDCFNVGANLIGLVHYPPSPRHLSATKIHKILDDIGEYGRYALVVVDQLPDEQIVSRFHLVQSYGNISDKISIPLLRVIKDYETYARILKSPTEDWELRKPPRETDIPLYCLEMSQGLLPGGNGAAWDWSVARPFCERYPTFIAGGITPENVADIIRLANPWGIDVSSGVESAPGVKDMDKVKRLIENVHKALIHKEDHHENSTT